MGFLRTSPWPAPSILLPVLLLATGCADDPTGDDDDDDTSWPEGIEVTLSDVIPRSPRPASSSAAAAPRSSPRRWTWSAANPTRRPSWA